jgi:hypothetical protein
MDTYQDPLPTRVEVKESAEVFVPDYKYATAGSILEVTVNHLARLEADLHSLRMVYVANGKNPHALIAPNKTVAAEMAKISGVISELEDYFSGILEHENNLG